MAIRKSMGQYVVRYAGSFFNRGIEMIREWVITEPGDVTKCAIGLSGRGGHTETMQRVINEMELPFTLNVSMRPFSHAWYPQPTNSMDQAEAVAGIPVAVDALLARIEILKAGWGLTNKDIALLGFSAGAVIAIQTALACPHDPFKAVVSFGGAILEPENVPPNDGCDTRFILQHNKDDFCFDWDERYIPMKKALRKKGYKLSVLESRFGNHSIAHSDVISISNVLRPLLCDDGDQHSESFRTDKKVHALA